MVSNNWNSTCLPTPICSSRGSSEVDSDVEDAIYAQMYFEEAPSAVESTSKYSDNAPSL